MNKFKAICVGLLIFLIISGLISYFLKASFVLAPILTTVFLTLIGVVHTPESMPGEYDNPEGKGVHPFAILAIMSGIILVCVAVWYIFPITSSHGLHNVF